MKIAAAEIQMQSSHLAFSRTETTERLEMWVGRPPARQADSGPRNVMPPGLMSATPPGLANRTPPGLDRAIPPGLQLAPPSARVALSQQAIDANAAEQVADDADPLESDPRLKMMATMIEILTGRPVTVLKLGDFFDRGTAASVPPMGNAAPRQAAGFGIEYELTSTRVEFEQTRFEASGVIRTQDGQEIRFDLAFAMERSYIESTSISFRAGDARLKDPLVLDFAGPAAKLQDIRFAFDLDGDGQLDQIPLLGGGRGFLAIDRNENGRIDDGRELFGPTTGNGFAELAALDADGNGWIDEADPAYAQLRLWQPDGNGGVVQTLADAGVGALYLGNVATPFDLRNAANETLGVMRASSIYLGQDGRVGTVSQIDLSV